MVIQPLSTRLIKPNFCNRDPAIKQELREHVDPRKPCDRVLTNERVSDLLRKIKECEPSSCVLNSIEHAKDDGLPRPLKEKALTFMSVKTNKSKSCEEKASSFLEYCQVTNDEVRRVEMGRQNYCFKLPHISDEDGINFEVQKEEQK